MAKAHNSVSHFVAMSTLPHLMPCVGTIVSADCGSALASHIYIWSNYRLATGGERRAGRYYEREARCSFWAATGTSESVIVSREKC